MIQHFRTCLFAVLAAVLVTACNTDLPAGKETSFAELTFIVGGDEALTKAAVEAKVMEPVDLSKDCGVEGLLLTETVTSLDEEYFPVGITDTKGTPIYTENFDALVGGFAATAFEPKADGSKFTSAWGSSLGDKGTIQFTKTAARTYSYDFSNALQTGVDYSLRWPAGNQLLFFMQAPYATTKALNPQFYASDKTHPMGRIEFDYTSPTSSGAGKDAEAQKDILFTSKLISESSKNSDNNLLFYHALTGVKFKAGNKEEQNTVIKKVVIKNIAGSGHCAISPNYTTNSSYKSAVCVEWTPGSASSSFTQTFTGTVMEYSKGKVDQVGTVPESFSAGGTALYNLNDNLYSQTFMLIPQKFGEGATLTVYYTLNESTGNTDVYERTISLKDVVWKAGELHTYTLTVNDIRVDINDQMSSDKKEKSNIQTKNNGNVDAYLRCALVADWVYDDPDTKTINENVIVSPCDIFNTGTFLKDDTGGGYGFKSNWIVGDDGYIYYCKPVLPYKSTIQSLFHMYYAPTGTPYHDAHLEIGIALQGVQFDAEKAKVTTAWGVDKVNAVTLEFSEPDAYGNRTCTKTPTGKTIKEMLQTTPEKP